jgi:hypothetical protein
MKVMKIVRGKESTDPPPPGIVEAIERLAEEAIKSGALVARGGLLPSAQGARIRLAGGQMDVKDGPFTEGREVIGGFSIYEVESMDKAVEMARSFLEVCKKHWPAWEGEVEIRPMFGFGVSSAKNGGTEREP